MIECIVDKHWVMIYHLIFWAVVRITIFFSMLKVIWMSPRRTLTLIVGSSQVAWNEMTTLQVFIWTQEGIFALSKGNSSFIIKVKMKEEGREGRRQRKDVKRDVSCSPLFICSEWVMKNWYSTCSTGHVVLVELLCFYCKGEDV